MPSPPPRRKAATGVRGRPAGRDSGRRKWVRLQSRSAASRFAAMVLDPAFVADCPYAPSALLIDDIVAIDREASAIVARMATTAEQPLTRDQRADPVRHPRHVSGALMIHATGILGFAHAYHILELRHAD